MDKQERPISPRLATILGMVAALSVDPTRDESIPFGYACTACKQDGQHGENCQRPRSLVRKS